MKHQKTIGLVLILSAGCAFSPGASTEPSEQTRTLPSDQQGDVLVDGENSYAIWPALEGQLQESSASDEENPWRDPNYWQLLQGGGVQDPEPEPGDPTPEKPGEEMAQEQAQNLRIVHYFEGEGSQKRLLIFNASTVSARECELEVYSNGANQPSRSYALEAEIAPGAAWGLCSSAEAERLPFGCDQSIGSAFNGNDALRLVCAGQAQQTFGRIGEDPAGGSWTWQLQVEIGERELTLLTCKTEESALYYCADLAEELPAEGGAGAGGSAPHPWVGWICHDPLQATSEEEWQGQLELLQQSCERLSPSSWK